MDRAITLEDCLSMLAEMKANHEHARKFMSDEICLGRARADVWGLCGAGIPWGTGPDGIILLSSSAMKSAEQLGLVR